MSRTRLYVAANAAFVLLVLAGLMVNGPEGHPLYVVLLFALCSSPILNVKHVNDQYMLLSIFNICYFFWFGFEDFSHLLFGQPELAASGEGLGTPEQIILVGGALAQAAYRLACRAPQADPPVRARDWPEGTLGFLGLILWSVSTWFVWKYSVEIIADASAESVKRGLSSLTPMEADGFVLATYFQPFSIMVLSYALFKYKRAYMIPLVSAAVLVQFILGFVADAKGQALSGLAIVFVSKFLVDRKIPKLWLAAGLVIVAVAFPLLQANRAVRHQTAMSHAAAAENLAKVFAEALEQRHKTTTARTRTQTIFERLSLKDTLATIVNKTSSGIVPFRHGDTLVALLTTFIPRVVWPDKPGIQVGMLVAKEFYPGQSGNVNLSPSNLAELFWNFGWPGVMVGMPLIGALFGFVASRCNLTQATTLTRVLILLVTIQVLVQGFEASIAIQYSVWLRMMLGIGLLHWFFARRRRDSARTLEQTDSSGVAIARPRFSNILP